jgi:hypothetical protein
MPPLFIIFAKSKARGELKRARNPIIMRTRVSTIHKKREYITNLTRIF